MNHIKSIFFIVFTWMVLISIPSAYGFQVVFYGGSVVDIEIGGSYSIFKYDLFRDDELYIANMVSPDVIYYSDNVLPGSRHTYHVQIFQWNSNKNEWVDKGVSERVEVDTRFYSGDLYNEPGNRFKRPPISWSGHIQTRKEITLVNGRLPIARDTTIVIDGNFTVYSSPVYGYEEANAGLLVRDVTFTASEDPNSATVVSLYGYDGSTYPNTPIDGCFFNDVHVTLNECKNLRIVNNVFSGDGSGIYAEDDVQNLVIENNTTHEGETYISIYGDDCEVRNNLTFGLDISGQNCLVEDNQVLDRLLIDGNDNLINRCYMKDLDIDGNGNFVEHCIIQDHRFENHPEVGAVTITWGDDNSIVYCEIRNNGVKGILLTRAAERNLIAHNVIENNRAGIEIYGYYPDQICRDNRIFDNLLRNNTKYNALDDGENNRWSEGSLSLGQNILGGEYTGGNYYSDYTGLDDNRDGIGDTPYTIQGTAGAVDPYPLYGHTGYRLETQSLPAQSGTIHVSPDVPEGIYEENAFVTLTATPSEGYLFEQWSGDHSSQDNSITLEMDRNKKIFALFIPTEESGNGAHATLDDPVNTGNGEFYFTRTLLHLGGPLPLSFSLYYGSNVYKKTAIARTFGMNLGSNFLHSHCLFLESNATQSAVKVYYTHGRILPFSWDPENEEWTFTKKNDIPFQLARTADYWLLMDPSIQLVYRFSLNGSLQSVEDRNGNKHTLTYNNQGWISAIVDGLGREITFEYTNTRLTKVQDNTGRAVRFTYTDSGHLFTITDPLERTTRFEYDPQFSELGVIQRIIEPGGDSLYQQDYDFRRRVISQTDALGNATVLQYGEDGSTRVLRPDGSIHTQIHDGMRVLTDAIDPAGLETKIGYDADQRRSSLTDRMDNQTHIDWDTASGYAAEIVNALGDVMKYSYQSYEQAFEDHPFVFQDLSRIDHPDGSYVLFTYDERGNLLTRSDVDGNTWRYTYNLRGQVLSEVNPSGGLSADYTYNTDGTLASLALNGATPTLFEYDNLKRRTKFIYPDGLSMEIKYNLADQVIERRDEKGNRYLFEYDENGNLVTYTDASGHPIRYHYDAMNRVISLESKMGATTRFEYDSLGRRSSMLDPEGFATHYQYTSNNQVHSVTQGVFVLSNFFDSEGSLTRKRTPSGVTYTYENDNLGRIVAMIDPLGARTEFNRDSMGRIVSISDPLQRTTQYTFNRRGLLTSISQRDGETVHYHYNALDKLSRIVDQNGKTWHFDYTLTGQLQSQTDPLGHQWNYAYDSRGRRSQIIFPDHQTVDFTYDPANNITQKKYSDGLELNYGFYEQNLLAQTDGFLLNYDLDDRPVQTICSGIINAASYDASGRLIAVGYDNYQMTVSYDYDPATGLLSRVSDDLTGTAIQFQYDAGGQLVFITRPNQVNTTYSWDPAGRVTRIQEGSQIDLQYTLNPAGQVEQLNALIPLGDPLAFLSVQNESNEFDDASQIIGPSYEYDLCGRLLSSPGQTYAWDGASRLVQRNDITLEYNGLGALIARTEKGITRQYGYNAAIDQMPIFSETIRSGDPFSRFYVWTPGGALLYAIDLTSNKRVTFYHFDRQGSTIALSSASGILTDTYSYSPFGRLLAHQGDSNQPFQYAGRWGVRAEGDNLYDMRNRFYDAQAARFLSREPDWPCTSNAKRLNPYTYALNDPINAGDFNGLEPTLQSDGQGGWIGTVSGRHYNSYLAGLGEEVHFVNDMALPLDQLIQQRFNESLDDGGIDLGEWDRTLEQTIQDWRQMNPVDESQLALDELVRWRMAAQSGWDGDEMDALHRNAVDDWKRWHPQDESQMSVGEFIEWRLLGDCALDEDRLRELIQEWQNAHMGERVSVEKWLARYVRLR